MKAFNGLDVEKNRMVPQRLVDTTWTLCHVVKFISFVAGKHFAALDILNMKFFLKYEMVITKMSALPNLQTQFSELCQKKTD